MEDQKNILNFTEGLIERSIADRQSLQRRECEDFLLSEIEKYPERQKKFWKRNYSSIEKYLASVENNRKRWLETVGDFSEFVPLKKFEIEEEPFLEDDDVTAKWIHLKIFEKYTGRAVIGFPKKVKKLFPLVICQHGYTCAPEKTFGFGDKENYYHSYAYRLAKEGYAVLSPLNITVTDYNVNTPTGRINRLALLLGKTLFGLEIFRTMKLIDYVSTLKEIDKNRIGMWGLSKGGTYTLFTLPVEKRIKVGIISAFFNARVRRMVVEDPRYPAYLLTNEEHMFVPGWLREFTDSDLVSLICPRPLMIQTGKEDAVSWWLFVVEEFENAKEHYKKLKIEDRIEMYLHTRGS